jgi:hypothetical protein
MVHDQDITDAQNILLAAPNSAGVNLLVVPDSIGTGDNPAITIKKPLHVSTYQRQLTAPECVKYVDAALLPNWPALVAAVGIDTILVKEGIVQGRNDALKRQVIWHELGHVLHGAAESGQVYLHEVTLLFNHYGAAPVQALVAARTSQFQTVPQGDPNRAPLAAFLALHWNIAI